MPDSEYKPPSTESYRSALEGQGFKVQIEKIGNKTLFIIGDTSEKYRKIFKVIAQYKRSGFDCEPSTMREVVQGRATGYFKNEFASRHYLPSIKSGEAFVAYDDPLDTEFNIVVFVGPHAEVSRAIESFYKIDHPYGRGFHYIEGFRR